MRPLAFAQERLWIVDQLGADIGQYTIAGAVRLTGALDVERLECALQAIVARHEVLRARFALHDGAPVMLVDEHAEFTLERGGDLDAELRRPFDLATGPLVRATLINDGPGEHVLLMTTHHIVSDAWSMGLFVHELSALYAGETLTPLPLQYSEFAAWQRERLTGETLDDLLAYWRTQLDGLPPVLELAADHPRPAVQTFRGARLRFSLPPVPERPGVTPFMVLLAAFGIVLGRWSGRTDIAVASPVAGRSRVEAEALIGCFVNTLVLRLDLAGDPTVEALLRRARTVCLEALSHAELPFERLVEELAPERSLAHMPLAQVALVLQNAPRERLTLPGLEVTPLPLAAHTSKFDLSLSVSGFEAVLDYSTDRFTHATVERFARDFRTALAGLATDGRVADIALVDARERERLNATTAAVSRHLLHERFEAQADLHPQAIAVRCGDAEFTYGELERRANRLAHRLVAQGITPGAHVAVCLERSPELVIAMLAVLKAGGAFVAIDPALPPARRTLMLEGTASLIDRVDDDGPGDDSRPARHGGEVAYVIYTSGSTGLPKGVLLEHRGIGNLVDWARTALGDLVATPWTVFHSYGFDFAVWETFVPLSHGGTAVIVPTDVRDPEAVLDLLERERIGVFCITPSGFRMLTSEPAAWPQLGAILFGGEALDGAHIPAWFRDDVPVRNLFGPAEITVLATSAALGREPGPAPIGTPIGNTRVYVLDEHLQPVPQGVAGELYIGGAGIARGYLNRPALTAEGFVPDPFGGVGERLYRSGDLVRTRPDGQLEFVGRRDRQVKVRGHRIELGEIEAALGDAVVLERGGRLIAYVRGPVDEDHLRATLPEAMIPSAFVTVDAWPLTPNGKLDHAALPDPDNRPARSAAPQGDVERALAAVWADVLGVEQVGRSDDFFGLGGDSITAIHVVARARRAGLAMRARDVFAHPTIEALAPRVATVFAADEPAEPGPVPLAPAQAWFFGLGLERPHHFNQSALVQTPEPLDASRLRDAFAALTARHDALRVRFDGPGQTLTALAPPVTVTEAADLEAAAPAAQASLDLTGGRLLAAVASKDRLLIVVHHLVVDAVSWPILVEDLQALYDGAPLPPPTLSFARWARSRPAASVVAIPAVRGRPEAFTRVTKAATYDAVVAALTRSLGEGFDVEGHGRDRDADLSRTIGWFTDIRHVGDTPRRAVALNYVGRPLMSAPGAWRIVGGGLGGNRKADNARPYALEINAAHRPDGRLVLRFDHVLAAREAEAIADALVDELRTDFPDVSAGELARALARLQRGAA